MARLDALAALVELSLVRHDAFEDRTPAVTVHRLVQAAAHRRAETVRTAKATKAQLLARLSLIYPSDGYDNPASWPLCAQLTPHLLARCEPGLDEAGSPETATLLDRAGSYFNGRAAYDRAEPLFRTALAIRETVLGVEHPDTAASLNNLALVLHEKGDLPGALPLFERALAIDEASHGPAHPATAGSLGNLARLLQAQGNLAGARPLFERALAIREKALGPEHLDTALSFNGLAYLLQEQGDLRGARSLYERALAIRETALGPEHPSTATVVDNLAGLVSKTRTISPTRSRFTSGRWRRARRHWALIIP
ncbi:MAG: tetratricopeptide repeat protein [Hyphomicrobiales bacterium]